MAEVVENSTSTITDDRYASNSKGNAALSLGIVGTALAGLTALGGGLFGLFNKNGNSNSSSSEGGDSSSQANEMTSEDLYIERQQAQNYIDITKNYYEGKLTSQRELTNAFFDAYKRDVDNSFMLYKNQRDTTDTINANINQIAFQLYKNERDDKDSLNEKITTLQSKVDVMSAIRPYQDALINAKIDNNALMSDFKLANRTCRMIEGQIVLPDNLISGFTSSTFYNN